MVDIKDIEGLEAWLKTQPKRRSVVIAHRSMMRVLPNYWYHLLITNSEYSRKYNLNALLVLRSLLTSGVAAFWPTPEISDDIIAAARDVETEAYKNHLDASSYAADTFTVAAKDVGGAAMAATFAFRTFATQGNIVERYAKNYFFSFIKDEVLTHTKLWLDGPDPFAKEWRLTKVALQDDPIDWSFWIKWYEASLNGEPLNYDMLEKIALIDPKDWEQGPEHVNTIIAGIEKAYLLKATPLAERMELNPATERLRIIPERMSQKALYNNVLETIRDGMEDLRESPQFTNALAALQPVFEDILDRTLTKYASSPQRVHDDFTKAKKRIQRLMDVGELSSDDTVVEFVDDLDKGAANIRANIPAVREAFAALAALRVAESSEADISALQAGAEYVAQHSDPELAEEMREDSRTLVASRDVPEGAPPVLAPDPAYRLSNRLPRAESILAAKNAGKVIGGVGDGFTFAQVIEVILRLLGL